MARVSFAVVLGPVQVVVVPVAVEPRLAAAAVGAAELSAAALAAVACGWGPVLAVNSPVGVQGAPRKYHKDCKVLSHYP